MGIDRTRRKLSYKLIAISYLGICYSTVLAYSTGDAYCTPHTNHYTTTTLYSTLSTTYLSVPYSCVSFTEDLYHLLYSLVSLPCFVFACYHLRRANIPLRSSQIATAVIIPCSRHGTRGCTRTIPVKRIPFHLLMTEQQLQLPQKHETWPV